LVVLLCSLVIAPGGFAIGASAPTPTPVVDALGRHVEVPAPVDHLICSGPGCLRLASYLQLQDLVVGVDDMETRRARFAARPYALAHPELARLPEFGEFRGHDHPERILMLDPAPDVIVKSFAGIMGHDPAELQARTGIPVVALADGDLGDRRAGLDAALHLLGELTGRQERAAAVVAFLDDTIADLRRRTAGIAAADRPRVYLGGVAFRGPHGLTSTEPAYPPFALLGAHNLAATAGAGARADVAREMIVVWDPDHIFLDLSTLELGAGQGGLDELRHDPIYRDLTAVREGRVHGVLPYNWYSQNFGSILANAYFVGKTLYPDRFADIDPAARADEIYTFLVGAPVFGLMDEAFGGLAFQRLAVD
jgi:iron complex transport system substrate-binding protein